MTLSTMDRALLAGTVALGLASATSQAHARDRSVAEAFERSHPCPSTGLPYGACPGWTRDHLVPLCAGGADAIQNLWWEDTRRSLDKDQLEFRLCHQLYRADRTADPSVAEALRISAWDGYWAALCAMGGEEAARPGQ